MSEQPEEKQVTVTVAKFHTLDGDTHEPGDTYDVAASKVGNLVAQGLVVAPPDEPAPPAASHPVEPLTTDDFSTRSQ